MGARECQSKGIFTTVGPLLGQEPKPLLTPTFTSRLLPYPVFPSPPWHLGKALSQTGALKLRLGLCLHCQPKDQPIAFTLKGRAPWPF